MKLLSIKPSERATKKYMATFCLCEGETKCCDKERKHVHFGQKGSSTYIDHKDDKKKVTLDNTLFPTRESLESKI